MMWRTHSCAPRRDSSQCLVLNLYHRQTGVETSLDTARTSACATVRQRISEREVLSRRPRSRGRNSKETADDCLGDSHRRHQRFVLVAKPWKWWSV